MNGSSSLRLLMALVTSSSAIVNQSAAALFGISNFVGKNTKVSESRTPPVPGM